MARITLRNPYADDLTNLAVNNSLPSQEYHVMLLTITRDEIKG